MRRANAGNDEESNSGKDGSVANLDYHISSEDVDLQNDVII
jgi:hypothetical protein